MIHDSNKGFTLIELLTAVAVIGIVSAFVLTNLNTGKKQKDVQRAAQKLMLDIRKAQNLSLAPSETSNCIYGVKLKGDNEYLLYRRADCSGGEYYYSSPISNPIETITLASGVKFIAAGGFGLGKKDVAFESPEPVTYLEGATTTASLTVTLQSLVCSTCVSKNVVVNRFGMVEIQ